MPTFGQTACPGGASIGIKASGCGPAGSVPQPPPPRPHAARACARVRQARARDAQHAPPGHGRGAQLAFGPNLAKRCEFLCTPVSVPQEASRASLHNTRRTVARPCHESRTLLVRDIAVRIHGGGRRPSGAGRLRAFRRFQRSTAGGGRNGLLPAQTLCAAVEGAGLRAGCQGAPGPACGGGQGALTDCAVDGRHHFGCHELHPALATACAPGGTFRGRRSEYRPSRDGYPGEPLVDAKARLGFSAVRATSAHRLLGKASAENDQSQPFPQGACPEPSYRRR